MRKRDFLCREVFIYLSVIVLASLLFFVPSAETRFVSTELTVQDKETGLMWTRDANIVKKVMDWNSAFRFIKDLNKQKYAGYSDWRLPSKEELETLVDFVKEQGMENVYTYFNLIGFKNYVMTYYYWSSTTYADNTGYAWVVYILHGDVRRDRKPHSHSVWPVRSAEVTASSKDKAIETRFVFLGLTALDKETGYMWTRDANIAKNKMNWDDAFKFVESLNEQKYAGYSDWRLPNKEELWALVYFAKGQGYIKYLDKYFNLIGFKDVQSDYYWSSTVGAYSTANVWIVYMNLGFVAHYPKTNNFYVWPVRSGNKVTASPKDKAIETRFVFSDLTALDKETKYMWTRDANIAKMDMYEKMNWDDAFKFVESLNEQKYAGYSDWRLPSEKEILTLVDLAKGQGYTEHLDKYFNEIGFKNVKSGYWSSTTNTHNSAYAWVVYMNPGLVTLANKSTSCYIWPVRGGQVIDD